MIRKSRWTLVAAAAAVLAIAIPGFSVAASSQVGATLKGNSEVPGPGDPNGKGEVAIKLKPAKRKLCFTLEISKLDGASAGHIHKGAADAAGPIKVTLFDSAVAGTGNYEGCVKRVKRKLLRRIAKTPEKYYVNVHNGEYPDGAIRGQLAKIPAPTP